MTPEHHGAFGQDPFGRAAEKVATASSARRKYIVGQTIVVVLWIAISSIAVTRHWDPYPFNRKSGPFTPAF